MKQISEEIAVLINSHKFEQLNLMKIGELDIRELVIYNFINYPLSYVTNNFLYATKIYWETLTYLDYVYILTKLENNSDCIKALMIFIEKHFQINALSLLNSCNKIEESEKNEILDYFSKRKAILTYKGIGFEEQLNKYSLNIKSFQQINLRLLEGGAQQSIEYSHKEFHKDGIKIIDLTN